MRPAATRPHASSTLSLAFELGNAEWKLAMTIGLEHAPLVRTIPARDLKRLDAEIAQAKAHFGLPASAPVQSCYEAGRDGFWLHRYLLSRSIANMIVDSASIEVNRHTNRIKGLLAGQGAPLAKIQELPTHLVTVRLWDGSTLPPRLCARLTREWQTVLDYSERIQDLKVERRKLLRATDDPAIAQVHQLNQLRGIGFDSAWLYVMEFFAWRQFRNRRQVGGLAGLTDTHYQSGDLEHQQGISKAGNRWVRALAINTAWSWLRYQPRSALA